MRSGLRVYGPLIAGCLVPLLLALSCQAFYTVSVERQAMQRGLENKAASLATMMVNITGPSLVMDDVDAVKDGLAYLKHDDDIVFAGVAAPDGRVVAFASGDDMAKWAPAMVTGTVDKEVVINWHRTVLASAPVHNRNKWLGTVVVGLGSHNIDAAVASMIVPAVGIALVGIAAAIAAVLLLSGALFRRNRDLKLLMDTADQGFMRVDSRGRLLPEHSAVLEAWFGPWRDDLPVWEYFADVAPAMAEWLELMWENLDSDIMPVEVSLEQLPHEIHTEQHSYRIEYKVIGRVNGPRNYMLVVSDITAHLAQERAKVEQGDMLALFTVLMRDRMGVEDFYAEARRLVRAVVDEDDRNAADVRRDLHTLKGNSRSFGFVGLANLCHTIEDHLEEGGESLSHTDRAALRTAWNQAETMLKGLSTDENKTQLDLDVFEQMRLLQMIDEHATYESLHNVVASWSNKSVRRILGRFARQARDVARRLGKGDVNTKVEADGVRIPPDALTLFWSAFGHAVTNAVDHGLESGEERVRLGKSSVGSVTLTAMEKDDGLVVELEDDGRGIDWQQLAAKAKAAGLPHARREELLEVMYRGGMSTKDGVTVMSGRGVGLGAVHAACVKTGGTLQVFSEPMQGTRFVFRWPSSALTR